MKKCKKTKKRPLMVHLKKKEMPQAEPFLAQDIAGKPPEQS